jgi:uncharacterized membrane protein YqhA
VALRFVPLDGRKAPNNASHLTPASRRRTRGVVPSNMIAATHASGIAGTSVARDDGKAPRARATARAFVPDIFRGKRDANLHLRAFAKARAVAPCARLARVSRRESPAAASAAPRTRVRALAARTLGVTTAVPSFGSIEKRQRRLPRPTAYHNEVTVETDAFSESSEPMETTDAETKHEQNDDDQKVLEEEEVEEEERSSLESFSPQKVMTSLAARSLEESLDSRAVQRALASSVAQSLLNAKPGSTYEPLTTQESDAIGEKVVLALRQHARRRDVGRRVEYVFVRSALAATSAFVLFGVCASLALSALLFTMGVREVMFDAVAAWIRFSPVELVTAAVGALDRFLLGMVCVIFGVGAFEVFLARWKTDTGTGSESLKDANLRRLRWLHIDSVDDLEQQVSGIVVAVLVVNILELSLHMTFSTPVDLVFASMAPLACAGALALLHLSAHPKASKKDARGRNSRRTGRGAHC